MAVNVTIIILVRVRVHEGISSGTGIQKPLHRSINSLDNDDDEEEPIYITRVIPHVTKGSLHTHMETS